MTKDRQTSFAGRDKEKDKSTATTSQTSREFKNKPKK
jgi:hypothetical protein